MFSSFLIGLAGACIGLVGVVVLLLGLIALTFGGPAAWGYLILGAVLIFSGAYLKYVSRQTVRVK